MRQWMVVLVLLVGSAITLAEVAESTAPDDQDVTGLLAYDSLDVGDEEEHPLLGRPDGHELHKRTQSPLIGRPDGHEQHGTTELNLIGRPDGHEQQGSTERPLIGRPDGHDTSLETDDTSPDNDVDPLETNDDDDISKLMPDTDDYHADRDDFGRETVFNDEDVDYTDDDYPDDDDTTMADKPLLGRPDGHEPLIRCKRPLCMMYCTNGFKTDHTGCPICQCRDEPEGLLPCPEPMCANFCPGGYKKNPKGCMTCDCADVPPERVCSTGVCDEGQVCRNKTETNGAVARTCAVKTLCETRRSQPQGLGSVAAQCEEDGSFKPQQCNVMSAECWCVDGLGQEVEGTRSVAYIDEQKPKCVRNITVSVHIHMVLMVRHDIDIDENLDMLNATIVDHVSSWMLIEPHYIKLTKSDSVNSATADASSRDDDDNEDSDDDDVGGDDGDADDRGMRMVVIELVVVHDGKTDLPSAADYMQRRMRQGHCNIPVGGESLRPDPDQLMMHHTFAFEQQPQDYEHLDREESLYHRLCKRPVMRVAVYCLCATILVVIWMVVIAYFIRHRHRRSAEQFKHRRLENEVSGAEKDLLEPDYRDPPPYVASDKMSNEKEPIA